MPGCVGYHNYNYLHYIRAACSYVDETETHKKIEKTWLWGLGMDFGNGYFYNLMFPVGPKIN